VIKLAAVIRRLVNQRMLTSFSYTLTSRHISVPLIHIRSVCF